MEKHFSASSASIGLGDPAVVLGGAGIELLIRQYLELRLRPRKRTLPGSLLRGLRFTQFALRCAVSGFLSFALIGAITAATSQ